MNRERLEILATHLESGQLFHQVFDFRTYNADEDGSRPNGCGTSGCALGECPGLFPDKWTFNRSGYPELKGEPAWSTRAAACAFFDISEVECDHLFHGLYWVNMQPEDFGGKRLSDFPSKEEVAANIRGYLETFK